MTASEKLGQTAIGTGIFDAVTVLSVWSLHESSISEYNLWKRATSNFAYTSEEKANALDAQLYTAINGRLILMQLNVKL